MTHMEKLTHTKKSCCVVYVAVVLLALMPRASAEDPLKVAVARHGGWESAPVELGQQAGMFKKHGIALDLVYLKGSKEVEHRVISGSAEVGLAVGAMAVMRASVCATLRYRSDL